MYTAAQDIRAYDGPPIPSETAWATRLWAKQIKQPEILPVIIYSRL